MLSFTWVLQYFMASLLNYLRFILSPMEALRLKGDDASELLNMTLEYMSETHSVCQKMYERERQGCSMMM